uniref:NADH dehydrogenase subunit 6 n=1 Tax=Panagrolaimus sp. ES5 TaxID=591445 RepID=A0AC34F068_9BILA
MLDIKNDFYIDFHNKFKYLELCIFKNKILHFVKSLTMSMSMMMFVMMMIVMVMVIMMLMMILTHDDDHDDHDDGHDVHDIHVLHIRDRGSDPFLKLNLLQQMKKVKNSSFERVTFKGT